ncbi:MAG: hypothetical protein V7603_1332 [Micromonosporaceae bacterium]
MQDGGSADVITIDPVHRLLTEVERDEWGRVSASVYETARLVALAPALPGHRARVDYLLRTQARDGSWGAPDGYALVPTLSATAALLGYPPRGLPDGTPLVAAAQAGLSALRRLLPADGSASPPDTIAVEMIVPALVGDINDRLRDLPARAAAPLRPPEGMEGRPLERLRAAVAAGRPVPGTAAASLEVLGPAGARAGFAVPVGGVVGCSAAATAAWLGRDWDSREPAGHFLHRLQEAGGGPVPGVTPITYFEPAWVLNSLAAAGLPYPTPDALLDRLAAGLTGSGAPAAPGLPPDADDTAGVLCALMRHGRQADPDPLLAFQADGHFVCFPAERTPSTSANAHVLEALAGHVRRYPGRAGRYARQIAMVTGWLVGRQDDDGRWTDKWHASPYYATVRAVAALRAAGGAHADAAVAAAVRWVRETQRADGSWGRFTGSIEETAYALHVLMHGGAPVTGAVSRGAVFLATRDDPDRYPALWHAKDLYAPVRVVQAARLAALHLAGPHLVPAQRSGSSTISTGPRGRSAAEGPGRIG